MNEIEVSTSIFENIKHIDEFGHEYWFARGLMPVLNYIKRGSFSNIIQNAKKVCEIVDMMLMNIFPRSGSCQKEIMAQWFK